MEEIIHNYLINYGYICIFLIVLIEYANIPIPSEVVLPLIGVLIVEDYISFIPALLVSIIGGLSGSLINYVIGKYSSSLLTKITSSNKNEKLILSLEKATSWINKYGALSVMIGRVIPFIRTTISIPAGLIKMPITKFILFSSIGISIWNALLITLGIVFVNSIDKIPLIIGKYSSVAITFIVILALIILLKIYVNYKNNKIKGR